MNIQACNRMLQYNIINNTYNSLCFHTFRTPVERYLYTSLSVQNHTTGLEFQRPLDLTSIRLLLEMIAFPLQLWFNLPITQVKRI
jgi:hypothetical protein